MLVNTKHVQIVRFKDFQKIKIIVSVVKWSEKMRRRVTSARVRESVDAFKSYLEIGPTLQTSRQINGQIGRQANAKRSVKTCLLYTSRCV